MWSQSIFRRKHLNPTSINIFQIVFEGSVLPVNCTNWNYTCLQEPAPHYIYSLLTQFITLHATATNLSACQGLARTSPSPSPCRPTHFPLLDLTKWIQNNPELHRLLHRAHPRRLTCGPIQDHLELNIRTVNTHNNTHVNDNVNTAARETTDAEI